MSLRRFQNFSLGALNASRLNELVDAVARLEAQVNGMGSGRESVRDRILVRITGDGVATSETQCSNPVACVSYPFEEVMFSIRGDGSINEGSCVSYEVPDDAITSQRGAHLLIMEKGPSDRRNTCMIANAAPMSFASQTRQMIYIGLTAHQSGVRKMFITQTLPDVGTYMASTIMGGTAETWVMITNIYETSNHYGASLPVSNPNQCATIVPKRLGLGDEVFVWGSGESTYTMAPTRFESECVPCQTSPSAMNSTEIANAIEMSAAAIVLR